MVSACVPTVLASVPRGPQIKKKKVEDNKNLKNLKAVPGQISWSYPEHRKNSGASSSKFLPLQAGYEPLERSFYAS